MKKLMLGLSFAAVTATGWCDARTGWSASFEKGAFETKDFSIEKLNLGSRFKAEKPEGTFAQAMPWVREGAEAKNLAYAQLRVWNSPGSWMSLDFLGRQILPPCKMGFAFYTIPVYGPETKFPEGRAGQAPLVGRIGDGGAYVDFSEILLVGERGMDGVFVSAKRKDGTPLKPGETAKTGDLVTIRMPVISKPDSLRLSFREIDGSTEKGKTGNHLTIPIKNAPARLEPSAEDPLLYTATFELPKLPNERKVRLGAFVVRIDYAGVDSRIWGPYFGIAPFAVDFDGGARDGIPPASFEMYDFGPVAQAVMTGAKSVTDADTPAGFRWIRKPTGYEASHLRFFDNLVHDWMRVEAGNAAEFAVKVPKAGRYKVVFGCWPFGIRCWLNGGYKPLEYEISVNGKSVATRYRKGEMEDRFHFLPHFATADEDVYDTYVMPCRDEVACEAVPDANGEITVKFVSPKGADPKNRKNSLLNYLYVYEADNPEAAAFADYLAKNRRARFYAYWADGTSSIPDFRDALAVKEIPGTGLRMTARENALEWVLPQSKPLVNELGKPIRIKAARGERLSGAFLFNADYEAKDVAFTVTGLPESVHPRLLRQMPYRFTSPWNAIHQLRVNHLLPATPLQARKDYSYGHLLRLDVDENAVPGTYRGLVTARAADGRTATLDVELVIREIRLPKLSDHIIAMLASGSGPERMKLCKEELGCTSFVVGSISPQYSQLDFDKDGKLIGLRGLEKRREGLIRAFREYAEAGFDCPYPFFSIMCAGYNEADKWGRRIAPYTDDYRKLIRQAFGMVKEAAQAAGVKNVVFDLGGEMGYEAKKPFPQAVKDAIWCYKTIHEEVPGSLVSYRCNCYTTVDEFNPYLDIQGVRGKTSWVHADKITDYGRAKWTYTYSMENRFENGLKSWAHGARGNFREWMTWSHYEEFNDFLCEGCCGSTSHFELMPGPGGKFIPTLRSEAFRASVDDRKYFRLLDNAIREGKNKADVAKAQALRALMCKVVNDHVSDEGSGWSFGTLRGDGNNPWPGIRLDLVRDLCVRFAESAAAGKDSGLPSFVVPETDLTDFGLADGPLEIAGCEAVAAFANEKKYGVEALKGAKAQVCTADGRILAEAAAGAKDRCSHPSFYLPVRNLPAGTYTLRLAVGGNVKATTAFQLL